MEDQPNSPLRETMDDDGLRLAALQEDQTMEDAEAAAAAAEVAAMGQQTGRRGRDPTADQVIMGATNDEGGAGLEARDESGELVHDAFLQFLSQ
eukprot:scaffold22702_cov149-Cylindrotheca_fusiformis.AAC.2